MPRIQWHIGGATEDGAQDAGKGHEAASAEDGAAMRLSGSAICDQRPGDAFGKREEFAVGHCGAIDPEGGPRRMALGTATKEVGKTCWRWYRTCLSDRNARLEQGH